MIVYYMILLGLMLYLGTAALIVEEILPWAVGRWKRRAQADRRTAAIRRGKP